MDCDLLHSNYFKKLFEKYSMVENQLNCGFYFSELYAMLLEPVVFFQALLFYINSYFDLSKNVLKLHCCFYLKVEVELFTYLI